jgi:hypothetical protein
MQVTRAVCALHGLVVRSNSIQETQDALQQLSRPFTDPPPPVALKQIWCLVEGVGLCVAGEACLTP